MSLVSDRKGFDLGRGFYFLWCGESLAVIGTALMEFALGVWVYTHTGSAVAFANVVLAATLPAVLFLPLAGGLADRISHRVIIVCCDVSLAVLLLGVMALLWFERLEPLHLYIFNCLASIVSAFRKPAYQAAVSTIVAPDKFTRASGLISISKNASALVAPLLAGAIMAKAGLVTILAVDLVTFCSGTLLVIKAFSHVRPPAAHHDALAKGTVFGGALGNVAAALKFFVAERLMAGLLVYTMMRSALLALATLMMTPLLLSTLGSQVLGMAYTWAALGGLAGAGLLISMGNPRRLMAMVAVADLLLAGCVVALGMVSQAVAYCALAFVAITMASIADASVNALWMRRIPAGSRASVFALISMLTIAATSLAVIVGGFLVDHWFQPALMPGGLYADSIGRWLGTGPGRGVGLLFVVAGALFALLPLGVLLYGPMRRLDEAPTPMAVVRMADGPQVDPL
ncbi:MFS transporter [Pseudomonas corrugata]|uniref:MFS transporter n=1 Tax=Pseudomonas corrugata TaxID=47879 RepID=UPI001585E6E1|nr:MFS transporter [Pseudomonas corrugata]MCI0996676.1 MFS transporter [Pseudomonas corrugata]NUT68988.1 MFS transporter [Pseudomonas corrugata]